MSVMYRCDRCHEKLEQGVIGLVCRKCALFYNSDGELMFELTVATAEKIKRLFEGNKEEDAIR